MEIYHGRTVRTGVAIAAAARLKSDYGVPSLDPQRLRRLGARLRQFGVEVAEPEQAILVAETLPRGFMATPLPGLEFVGVAAQTIAGGLDLVPCPAVAGLPDSMLSSLEEGEIVIVDGDRGKVYVGPDAATLARYQTPARAAHRFFLGGAHLPARTTSDDRVIAVIARTPTLASVTEAVDAGADGLWVPPENDFLGPEAAYQTAAEQQNVLSKLLALTCGKPVYLHVPTERLALSALARASVSRTLRLVLEDLTLRDELAARFSEIESALEEEDSPFGGIPFEACLSTLNGSTLPETLDSYNGLWAAEIVGEARMDTLLLLAGLAHHAQQPLTLRLPEYDWSIALSEALDLGADRVAAPLTAISDVKDAIQSS